MVKQQHQQQRRPLLVLLTLLCLCTMWPSVSAWSVGRETRPHCHNNRRSVLVSTFAATTGAFLSPALVHSLDMDAFANQQLGSSSDSATTNNKNQLSSDEALCRYGSPSPSTGAACERAGISAKRSGSLDAYGNVDRGSFVRCKQFYDNNNGTTAYEKKTVCNEP